MNLRFIIITALILSILGMEGCNVVGDSAPEESANFVLDSLRLLPMEDEIALLDKPLSTPHNANKQQESGSPSLSSNSVSTQGTITPRFASINPQHKPIKRQGDSFATSFRHVPDSKSKTQSLSETSSKRSVRNRNIKTSGSERLIVRNKKNSKIHSTSIAGHIDNKVNRRGKSSRGNHKKFRNDDNLNRDNEKIASLSNSNSMQANDGIEELSEAEGANQSGIYGNQTSNTNPKKRRYRFSSVGSVDDGLARERAEQRIVNEEVGNRKSKKNLSSGRNRNSKDKSLLMSFSYDEETGLASTSGKNKQAKRGKNQRNAENSNSTEQLSQQELEQEKELVRASRGSSSASQMFGRSVTIALTGVDSRLGETQRHADANHILRIWLDKGEIEIFSIPRGTPVDAGFSSKSLNYLANLRSNKGRDTYLKKIAEISGVGKIDYWIELGFSQAMGVMELLGFKENAKTALRVIRSRKAFRSGDYQRCYNQSQFIRQMILRHFSSSTGVMGNLALRAALNTVETNLKYDVAKAIIAEIESKGFPKSDKSVEIKVRPAYRPEIQHIDLSDVAAVDMMNRKLETKLTKDGWIGKGRKPAFVASAYENKLEAMVLRAEKSVDRNPMVAINALKRIYEQRSWIQVNDRFDREVYMQRICMTLIKAYENAGFMIDADAVRYFYDEQKAIRSQEVSEK